jgi:hypothetical protein
MGKRHTGLGNIHIQKTLNEVYHVDGNYDTSG